MNNTFLKISLTMRYTLLIALIGMLTYGCANSDNGQLIGVQGRPKWYQADPFGMIYMPMGSYNMGSSDQDVPRSFYAPAKTVSIQAMYMDQTEISNNEYRQFVYYVRDSLARRLIAEGVDEDYHIMENGFEEVLDPPILVWKDKIYWDDPEFRQVLEELYYVEDQRYFRKREINVDKLVYTYWWIDLQEAAKYKYRRNSDDVTTPMHDRKKFLHQEKVRIYPDTLVWVADFSYSYNEPMAKMYFWHPAYDNYPVVGVDWKQAMAFCNWRTEYMNNFLVASGDFPVHDFRLPTEAEWEYAARGGRDLATYPWGTNYIRNSRGCFLGNFKPMRGNYIDDGGFHTVPVDSYNPNDFGLYCMAGNVAEWTSVAFEEAGYNWSHDLNPDLMYHTQDNDPPALKRKVVRGGSWKDVGFYLQVSTRAYEYEDTAKSYIGFRCVQTYMGRDKADAE